MELEQLTEHDIWQIYPDKEKLNDLKTKLWIAKIDKWNSLINWLLMG